MRFPAHQDAPVLD